ncbi:MAG: choice-of-anchor C family protein [Paracoccaceae bacterium]
MKHTLAAFALMLGTASFAQAATIQNGSFEEGSPAGVFSTLGAGSTAITGWTVGSGNIDYIGTYWQASAGSRSLDLTGNTRGSIFTTITDLIIGTAYKLSFDLSGNPAGQPAIKQLDVTLSNPLTTENYLYNVKTAKNTLSDMKWVTYVLGFVATSTESVITFATGNGTGGAACCYGPALDNVQISAVPVPAGGLLLLTGLAGFAAMRRRKKA